MTLEAWQRQNFHCKALAFRALTKHSERLFFLLPIINLSQTHTLEIQLLLGLFRLIWKNMQVLGN